jgi:hypothetical protein
MQATLDIPDYMAAQIVAGGGDVSRSALGQLRIKVTAANGGCGAQTTMEFS